MRTAMLLVGILVSTNLFAGPKARLTIKTLDEDGQPVGNATVTLGFELADSKKTTKVSGLTDTNGLFAGEGETHPNVSFRIVKDGYYQSSGGYLFTEANEVEYRFEPWGYTNTVVLRKIIDPKIGKKGVFRGIIPDTDKEVGYDVLIGDWVAPYGKGQVSDFILNLSYDESSAVASYTLTCPNEGDGLIELPRSSGVYSIFRWPYLAPENGYQSSLKKKRTYFNRDSSKEFPEFKELPREPSNLRYIFRIRTEYDDDGNLISAYYGKLGNAINIERKNDLVFGYWLNTDPHSRSLESTDPMSP